MQLLRVGRAGITELNGLFHGMILFPSDLSPRADRFVSHYCNYFPADEPLTEEDEAREEWRKEKGIVVIAAPNDGGK